MRPSGLPGRYVTVTDLRVDKTVNSEIFARVNLERKRELIAFLLLSSVTLPHVATDVLLL